MAEDSDLERTEPASQRRIEQAREKGQVARSPELSTFSILMAGGAGLFLMGAGLMEALSMLMRKGLTLNRSAAFDTGVMTERLFEQAFATLSAFAPFLLLMIVVAIVTPMLLSGWLFTFQALQFDFSRVNPLTGIKRIFSWQGLVGLVKAVMKTVLIGGVATWLIWHKKNDMLAMLAEPMNQALVHLANLMGLIFLSVAGSMLIVVAIDVPFQLWDYYRRLRMTKEEVRQEAKETEGDPQIKARIRSLQREAARRRMMAEVPKADVIVTNPTHYAVALRYRDTAMRAPQVVAKGAQLLAERIIEVGQEYRVPILRTPPLARALYTHGELGREIPAALYTAVAEVLAYVYQLQQYQSHGGEAPKAPENIPVPANMDPEARA